MKSKNLTLGLILVILGILLLLNNLGFLTWSVWKSLFDLWPLILVVIGLNIIFKNIKLVMAIAWLLFFAAIIGYGFYLQAQHDSMLSITGKDFSLEIHPETTYGILNLKLGGGELELLSTSNKLMEAHISNAYINHKTDYSSDRKTVEIYVNQVSPGKISINEKACYTFMLNDRLTWEIDGDIGAVNATVDLADLKVKDLDLDVGAANLKLIFGSLYDQTNVDIDAGASNLELVIPGNVGTRIKMEGLLKDTNLKSLNWQHEDDYYLSPNYHESDKKLHIQVNMAAGKLDVQYLKTDAI